MMDFSCDMLISYRWQETRPDGQVTTSNICLNHIYSKILDGNGLSILILPLIQVLTGHSDSGKRLAELGY